MNNNHSSLSSRKNSTIRIGVATNEQQTAFDMYYDEFTEELVMIKRRRVRIYPQIPISSKRFNEIINNPNDGNHTKVRHEVIFDNQGNEIANQYLLTLKP